MMIAVVFVVPVAFMHAPAFLVVVIVWMVPVGAGIRRAVPTAANPYIMAALISPVSVNPGMGGRLSYLSGGGVLPM